MGKSGARIQPFDLHKGRIVGGEYVVEEFLGSGWEGEVYRVVERRTGITRAAKLFYSERNPGDRTMSRYARKLERLRHCPLVIQYHHSEVTWIRRRPVTCLISEYVEGEPLKDWVRSQPGKRLGTFEGLHLLHSLAVGLECIHAAGEYHSDLHPRNVLVRRRGIGFDVKLFDFYHRGRGGRWAWQLDVVDAVILFHFAIGGVKRYAKHPPEIKAICRGLKHGLIRERFPTATALRRHLESFSWE